MSKEIEKIMAIRAELDGEDKKVLDDALMVIKASFEDILEISKKYILTGEKEARDFSGAVEALNTIKTFGDRVGILIPTVNEQKDAMTYIVKFGKDILF